MIKILHMPIVCVTQKLEFTAVLSCRGNVDTQRKIKGLVTLLHFNKYILKHVQFKEANQTSK